MIRIFFVLILLVCKAFAQDNDPLNFAIEQYNQKTYRNYVDTLSTQATQDFFAEYKSSEVVVKKFDQKKWKSIVGKTDYTEKKEKEPEPEKDKKVNFPKVQPWNSDILRIVIYVVIVAFILFIIYYVLNNTSLNFKRTVETFKDEETPIENIEELDVDNLLKQAIAQGNFRLAIRLYYLGLLQKLNETGVILWKKDKTNRDYLMEIFSQEYYNELRILTHAYEQVWYGEKALSKELFQKLAVDFESMDQRLNIVPK